MKIGDRVLILPNPSDKYYIFYSSDGIRIPFLQSMDKFINQIGTIVYQSYVFTDSFIIRFNENVWTFHISSLKVLDENDFRILSI